LLAERAGRGSPLHPTVSGQFSSDTLHAYLELYSDAEEQLKNATVVIEVAHRHDSTTLKSAAARFHESETPGTRVVEASVTLDSLPPGDYVARGIISLFGRRAGQIVRPFRIVKKDAD